MEDRFRLTIAQLNPILGDLAGNAAKAKAALSRKSKAH
jgi:NAD+ synthase